jgi:HD-GYP domain-containing protein (c-di-GMP phosphodiesterase class II)
MSNVNRPASEEAGPAASCTTSQSEILTQLLQDLDASKKSSDQIRTVLEAVRALIGTGIAYWYNDHSQELIGPDDDSPLGAEACREFGSKLVARRPDKATILWTNPKLSEPAPAGAELPTSAAALRVHRTRPGWIIAISFDRNRPISAEDVRAIGLAGAMLHKHQQHARNYSRIKDSLTGFVHCLAAVVDARDSYTAGHSERVSRIAVRLGRQMDLSPSTLGDLRIAGILHDVGKIGISDGVLLKPGKLTSDEYRTIQQHAVIGDQIISTIREFSRLRAGVRHHHERFDGRGYPDGLAGNAIPLLGRILAVADACDAMMSPRRYRSALPQPQIDKVLRDYAGSQWDPVVVEHFLTCRTEIYQTIYPRGIGDSAEFAIGQIFEELKDGSSQTHPVPNPELPANGN